MTQLSKADVRRGLVGYHLQQADLRGAFDRLRSVQFDPIAPVGCNHDLVLQSRVPDYKIGDWQQATYEERYLYDGWDKQASLVRFEGWPMRRVLYQWHREYFNRIFNEYGYAIDAVLKELRTRGPLLPKEFEFQEKKPDWRGSWHGPNLTKQTLRALWHAGEVMTHGRKGGHHVYDLAERIVPAHLRNAPLLTEDEATRELILDRHRAMGLIRPTAQYEVWSMPTRIPRQQRIREVVATGELVGVEVEGVKANVTPEFLAGITGEVDQRVSFIAPLDQLIWDRKMILHAFGFDYKWEIYVPESKRVWGYYVLPVVYGDQFVARAEFFCRKGTLEIRVWLWETEPAKDSGFWEALEEAATRFCRYCGAKEVTGNGPKRVMAAFRAGIKGKSRI